MAASRAQPSPATIGSRDTTRVGLGLTRPGGKSDASFMKTSRVIQFVAASVLVSIGLGVLLSDAPTGFATICFCLASVVLLRRSELIRSVPTRELWITVGVLAVLAAFMVLANHFIPKSA